MLVSVCMRACCVCACVCVPVSVWYVCACVCVQVSVWYVCDLRTESEWRRGWRRVSWAEERHKELATDLVLYL